MAIKIMKIMVYILLSLYPASTAWKCKPTTPNLMNIILGRCFEFQQLKLTNQNPSLKVNVSCSEVWNVFKDSFAFKDPCNDTADYGKLFQIINNKKDLTNQSMFWSGTKTVAHDFTYMHNGFDTLEDTFQGYIMNDLTWCGCKGGVNCIDGINYNACTCCDQVKDYWANASKIFAQNANDTAYIMINGSSTKQFPAYRRNSFFGNEELPTLGRLKKVKHLKVYVISNLGKVAREQCGEDTVEQLKDDAENHGIVVHCEDNPRMVNSILCAKFPFADQCKKSKLEEDCDALRDAVVVVSIFLAGLLISISAQLGIKWRKKHGTITSIKLQEEVKAVA